MKHEEINDLWNFAKILFALLWSAGVFLLGLAIILMGGVCSVGVIFSNDQFDVLVVIWLVLAMFFTGILLTLYGGRNFYRTVLKLFGKEQLSSMSVSKTSDVTEDFES